MPRLGLLYTWACAGAFVPALGRSVRSDRRLGQELEARVSFSNTRQAVGRVVKVELENGQEALQVGLLVDREIDVPLGEQRLRDRREVVAAALPALLPQALLLDRLRFFFSSRRRHTRCGSKVNA